MKIKHAFEFLQGCSQLLFESVKWQVWGWTRTVSGKEAVWHVFFSVVLSIAACWAAQRTRYSKISLPAGASNTTLEKWICVSQVLAATLTSHIVLGDITRLLVLLLPHQ